MTGVFSAERMRELDKVLGPEQRNTLLSALASQALDARDTLKRHQLAGEERALRRNVHRLKGAAEIVGAADLIDALRAVEACDAGEIDPKLLDIVDIRIGELIDAAADFQRGALKADRL